MFKRLLLGIGGALCLVAGLALVLSWWSWVVVLFKGLVGMALALLGMILLFLAKE